MFDMKYVIFENGRCIIFSEDIQHDTFANLGNIIAAGKIKYYKDVDCLSCFGESLSLNVKSGDLLDSQKIRTELFEE